MPADEKAATWNTTCISAADVAAFSMAQPNTIIAFMMEFADSARHSEKREQWVSRPGPFRLNRFNC
jgi:hypothetical protein